jgi:transaldolase
MENRESLLHLMTRTTPTVLWNDSCSMEELRISIEENGAIGATCNPIIVLDVLKKEMPKWKHRIVSLIAETPNASEREIAWRLVEEMSIAAASLLLPIFHRDHGRNGRLSIQTDPSLFRNAAAIVAQALRFDSLAPNMIVKIPATRAGMDAIEEATWRGVSVNATVSFTLSQAIAVAEAVERGLERRKAAGKDINRMGPVCTLMVGRLDDWLKIVAEKEGIIMNPGILDWAGVAVMKKAYRIYRERGYRLRLLSAAFRSHLHWSQFIGGEVVISPPFEWQKRYNASDVEVKDWMAEPVAPEIIQELEGKFADFRSANKETGLLPEQFDTFGPTRRTLRQFSKAVDDLVLLIRDLLIPNPDG